MSAFEQDEIAILQSAEELALADLQPSGRLIRGTAQEVRETMAELKAIRTFIAEEMVDGLDYGIIPGTGDKKNMLLPGAQKVNMFFNVYPEYDVQPQELGGGHVEYVVKTALVSRVTGRRVASGVGSCATMEKKYRYRDAEAEVTDAPVPRAYWDLKKTDPKAAQALIGGPDYKTVKVDGSWLIAKKTGEKVENPDIYDIRNTVLKMAKKRSLVDASIGLGCLSELFTQDLEDIFDIQVSGAGSAGPTSLSPSAGAPLSPRAAHEPPPASAPRPAASTPASGNGSHTAVIRLVSTGKAWRFQGVENAMFTDESKQTWKFVGDAVNVAEMACGAPEKVFVTYRNVKGDKGWVRTVTDARIARPEDMQ